MLALPQSQYETAKGIAEIIVPDQLSSIGFVLPMLAFLSQQDSERWFTWIAPPPLDHTRLKHVGFNLTKTRIMHTRDDRESLWILWDALANGKSGVVVANLRYLSERDKTHLEEAAAEGNTSGVILRSRSKSAA